jgi:carbamoyltransferase
MLILGLNAFHADSSACIIRDGILVAAAEEERFRRVKHWAGFPSHAVNFCLREVGARLDDVAHVALNQDSSAHLTKKLAYLATNRSALRFVLDRLRHRKDRLNTSDLLQEALPGQAFKGEIHRVEHHLAHLSSAFHVSPFEEATAVSVDGFGDFASAAWGIGQGSILDVQGRIFFPHSLGLFYLALTQYLGFAQYGDEYKVMGLAPYGEPAFLAELRRTMRIKSDGRFELNLIYFRPHHMHEEFSDGAPELGDHFTSDLEALLGPRRRGHEPLEQRHKDIARSVQAIYEEAFFSLLGALYRKHGLSDIVLAGGCAMNSVANGKIRRKTPFRRVYVQSAAGDAGGAIGAAFSVWHRLGGKRKFVMDHAYWGPRFGERDIDSLLQEKGSLLAEMDCSIEKVGEEEKLCDYAATAVAEGKVVGWFQGPMEWGPRALGNRSILCDPRRSDMKDLLNEKIKRRESFRPFAPSVLSEFVAEWFEENDDVPFMMQVFQIREEKRNFIPAVTHVDGSGRLQTVTKLANPRYHRLISTFHKMSGVPMVLNTSFNENEPIVCKPQEALDCFLRTKMDLLVLGDVLIRRCALSGEVSANVSNSASMDY